MKAKTFFATFVILALAAPAMAEPCIPDDTTACLLGGRFEVRVSYALPTEYGIAHLAPFTGAAADGGTGFWFFGPGNPEMLVKMVDGCGLGGHFWFFIAATTNVGFGVSVADTLWPEDPVYSYVNFYGHAATPVQDTGTIPCH